MQVAILSSPLFDLVVLDGQLIFAEDDDGKYNAVTVAKRLAKAVGVSPEVVRVPDEVVDKDNGFEKGNYESLLVWYNQRKQTFAVVELVEGQPASVVLFATRNAANDYAVSLVRDQEDEADFDALEVPHKIDCGNTYFGTDWSVQVVCVSDSLDLT